jgi:hypothetical protein
MRGLRNAGRAPVLGWHSLALLDLPRPKDHRSESRMKRIVVYLPEPAFEALVVIAHRRGISASELVRTWVLEVLETTKKMVEALS